jgi:hypothetical protein
LAGGSIGGLNVLAAIAGAIAVIALLAAAYFWAKNVGNYSAIRRALPTGLRTPEERLASYGRNFLSRFVAAAGAATVGDGISALQRYLDPTLRIDTRFAIVFAAALVLGNLAIAPLVPLQPFGAYLALFCAVMGAAYGTSDVQENRTLERIFAAGPAVDPKQATVASRWTRLKFLTLYFALPAAIGVLAKLGHDKAFDLFYGGLRLAPLVVFLVACLRPSLARVLWASRVSVVSALAGYYLFLSVIQAQDLFADTTFGGRDQPGWHIAFWASAFAAVAFIWALPVHYASRAAIEGDQRAWYVGAAEPNALIRWTPRILGMIPVVAVLLGVLGAAVETRYAMRLDYGLPLQFVLLSLGGWITLGFVILIMVERRNFVARFLSGPHQNRSQAVVWLCAGLTSIVFFILVLDPLYGTQFFDRAALVPVMLGSGVLLFGVLSRLSDRVGVPILGFFIAAFVILTAANAHFNDVRSFPVKQTSPNQIALNEAVTAWTKANHCEPDPKTCPPALIVAADGGASRAAYFSAAVVGELLDRLANNDPSLSKCADPQNPARCLFAFSGVSGGSFGLASAKAALLDAKQQVGAKEVPPCASGLPEDKGAWRSCLEQLVAGDYLSPVFIGLAFRDQLAPPIYPFTNSEKWGDRAVLLEKAWERNYLAQISGELRASDCGTARTDVGLCRPFATPRADGGWTPLLLLNGTSIQTGRRVITSEIKPIWSNGGEPQPLHPWAYDFFDIFGASCGSPKDDKPDNCASNSGIDYQAPVDVRLSTAALLSARFPIISPAAHVPMRGDDNPHGDAIVDGGYFENSGLSTALDVATGLKALGLTPIVLSISNNPTIENVQAGLKDQDEPECKRGPLHLEVRRAEWKSIWIRAAEILQAPLTALVNTRDGHADEAAQALKKRLQEWDAPAGVCDWNHASFFPIRVYAEGKDFAMPDVSMSWWLSPVVQKALDEQLLHRKNTKQLDHLLDRLALAGCSDCDAQGK